MPCESEATEPTTLECTTAGDEVNSEKLREPSQVINYQKDDWVRVEKPATQIGFKRKFRRDIWSEPVQILQVNDTKNVLIKETPET